jgi:hypothetical protein
MDTIAGGPEPMTDRGDHQLLAERGDWLVLTQQLVAAIAGCSDCFRPQAADGGLAASCQAALDVVHQGTDQASRMAHAAAAGVSSEQGGDDHPLDRLARSYAEAFRAVGVACLLAKNDATLAMSPRELSLIGLAHDAAQVLTRAVGLIVGARRLGSLVQMCEAVGEYEDRADAVFREAVAFRLGKREAERDLPGWSRQHAAELRALSALEALTDRCEDIADILLIVALVR